MEIWAWGGIGVGVLVLGWLALAFNGLVQAKNQVKEGWSGIEVQLKRRHDLVPLLVECVKGYRTHEAVLLKQLVQARAEALSAQGLPALGTAENGLARSLGSIVVVAEAYPELKASQNFQQLNASLVETEEQLQFARRYYNGSVRDYNNRVESFPGLLAARLFGYRPLEFFEVASALEREAPEVKL